MKKQKTIKINHGTARVDEDCSQETIDMINKLADAAYNMKMPNKLKQKQSLERTPKPNLPTKF